MDGKHQTARLSILIVSGLLFGGAGAGWLLHMGDNKGTPQSTADDFRTSTTRLASTEGVTTSSTEHVRRSAPATDARDNTLGLASATAATTEQQQEEPFTPTSMADATRAARSEVGREDPMAPPLAQQQSEDDRTRFIARAPRQGRSYYRQTVPPPPPGTTGLIEPPISSPQAARDALGRYPYNNGYEQAQTPAPMPKLLVAAEMRLVGLVDDKAIFCLPKDTANRLNLPTSVTMGPGTPWNGIKLVGISKESATLCDEKSRLYTKTLQSIH
jgi:hypothetical protein